MTEIWLHDTFFNLAAGMLCFIVAHAPGMHFFFVQILSCSFPKTSF